jgi:hypothetical protein
MAEEDKKQDDLSVTESQDGSATVDVPENMADMVQDAESGHDNQASDGQNTADDDHADDDGVDEEVREARRNRRRAKKDLIRKTNQEKDARLVQLQRENDDFRRRLGQLERNTKSEQVTRLDKAVDDANVRVEYAKMKLAEATQNSDGHAMVEAQALWHEANEEVRNLTQLRQQADRELKQHSEVRVPNESVQRNAAAWMGRNPWYRPNAGDQDSRIAAKVDELMVAQGWDPSDPDYWDELDSRLQSELPHRYNSSNGREKSVQKPRNTVGSSGREASAAYGGANNRTQFVLSPDRVRAMKEAGAWDNPERKAKMIKNFMDFDRSNRSN